MLKVPYRTLFRLILLFCLIGAWSVNAIIFDIYVMLFSAAGLCAEQTEYEPAPLVLAFVLGPLLEQNMRQALILSDGSLAVLTPTPCPRAPWCCARP